MSQLIARPSPDPVIRPGASLIHLHEGLEDVLQLVRSDTVPCVEELFPLRLGRLPGTEVAEVDHYAAARSSR